MPFLLLTMSMSTEKMSIDTSHVHPFENQFEIFKDSKVRNILMNTWEDEFDEMIFALVEDYSSFSKILTMEEYNSCLKDVFEALQLGTTIRNKYILFYQLYYAPECAISKWTIDQSYDFFHDIAFFNCQLCDVDRLVRVTRLIINRIDSFNQIFVGSKS